MTQDSLYMRRALDLALLGKGSVSPNPLVGCLIVHDNRIIGEGWHQKYGEAHAEVNAIRSVENKNLLKESVVYVNLEPCSHTGKTPPCADLLIQSQVKKVVIANGDTNPLVAGSGVKKLREAGIEVIQGLLEQEGLELNQRFFTFIEKQRPYIILKWAQTADGFIAKENYESRWISNEFCRQLVHRWRSEEDAVLIGTKTASHDNPGLTVRDWSGRNPVRIVIDRFLVLPKTLQVFDKAQKTLCYNVLKHEEQENLIYVRLNENNFIRELLRDLHRQNVQSVIIEGGALTLTLFIQQGLWDEARIFSSARSFESGIEAPVVRGNLISQETVFTDTLKIIQHGKNKHR